MGLCPCLCCPDNSGDFLPYFDPDSMEKKEKVHLFRGIINLVALVGIIVMLGYTWTELGVGDYLKDQNTESKFIEDEYVDPTDVEVVFPEQKRNLIYISWNQWKRHILMLMMEEHLMRM